MIKYFLLTTWVCFVVVRMINQAADNKTNIHQVFKTAFIGVIGFLIIFIAGILEIVYAS